MLGVEQCVALIFCAVQEHGADFALCFVACVVLNCEVLYWGQYTLLSAFPRSIVLC